MISDDGTHCLYVHVRQRADFFSLSLSRLSIRSVSRRKEREGEYSINISDNTYVHLILADKRRKRFFIINIRYTCV
jgi:hypothetical protein